MMMRLFFLTVSVGGAIALSPMAIFARPSYAATTIFRCETPNNRPTTIIRSSSSDGVSEDKPFLFWYNAFSPPRARQLCNQVSTQLQRRAQRGEDIRIITGRVQGKFVVCFASTSNGDCTANSEKLFTLAPGEDPNIIRNKLFDTDVRDILNESSGRTYGRVRLFIFW